MKIISTAVAVSLFGVSLPSLTMGQDHELNTKPDHRDQKTTKGRLRSGEVVKNSVVPRDLLVDGNRAFEEDEVVWERILQQSMSMQTDAPVRQQAEDTFPPTTGPTPRPTPRPTNGPTPRPTPGPSPRPTPRPTPGPSPRPTPGPTPGPSPRPTPGPSPRPTPDPTPGPSPRPTPNPTPGPTPAPTPNPTPGPTPAPTGAPSCELEMDVRCVVVDGSVRVPCDKVPEPEDEPECIKNVQYDYEITNTCNPRITPTCDSAAFRTFDMVRNGNLKSLMSVIPQGAVLEPTNSVIYVETGVEFNFCVSQSIDTNVRVTAVPVRGINNAMCMAEAFDLFDIGFEPDRPCKVAIDLACFIEDDLGTRTNCKDIPMPTDDDQCDKEVTFAYIVSNINSKDKTIQSLTRNRDGETRDIKDFLDRMVVPPGEFAVASETGVLDFCVERVVSTTVDITSEAFGVGELTCSDSDSLDFSIAIVCDVEVSIECFADTGSGYIVPCADFSPFDEDRFDVASCEHVLKYVYMITNTGPGPQIIENLRVTRNTDTMNILDRQFRLDPDDFRKVDEFHLVNYCEEYDNGIFTEVEVNADMTPVGGACSDKASYGLNPARAPCKIAVQPFIRCTLVDDRGQKVLCLDYVEEITDPNDRAQCLRDVTYEVTLINQGPSCIDIEKVTGRLKNSPNVVDITPINGVEEICPNEKLVVVHGNQQDLCDDDLEEIIIVEVNGGPPETCGGFGTLIYIPSPDEECSVDMTLSCLTSNGEPCFVQQTAPECKDHPGFVEFKFSGGTCDSSSNGIGDAFVCRDFEEMNGSSGVYIVAESTKGTDYFAASVAKGQRFKIGNDRKKIDESIVITIFDQKGGKMLQRMTKLVSCARPLAHYHTFGALTLMGFGNHKEHFMAPDNDFEFRYEIANTGPSTALLEEIIFAVNGQEAQRVYLDLKQLEKGAIYTGTEPLHLGTSSDILNVSADLYVESLSAVACNAYDDINIPVAIDPVAPETDCKCTKRPYAFKLRFVGGTCEESDNSQTDTFRCEDRGEIHDSAAYIMVADEKFEEYYYQGEVEKDGYFKVIDDDSKFGTDLAIKVVSRDAIVQILKFHISCSKPLYLGDTYGAIQVVGWKNKKQGTLVLGEGEC